MTDIARVTETLTAARGGSSSYLMDLAREVHSTAIEKGFWPNGVTDDVVGMKLALIHSEVTEVLEAIRKEKGADEIELEFSDVLIRLLDLYAALKNVGWVVNALDDVVYYKKNKNKTRPERHGVRF
jgi:NTP pyrophosphatase (non-canonical NTP hydrolase)